MTNAWFTRLDKLTREGIPLLTDFLLSIGDTGERIQIGDILRINPEVIIFRDALDTVTAVPHILTGEYREVDNTIITDVTTDFALANQHLYIDVQTVTTGGPIVITGASVDEASGVVTDADTETITITDDNARLYQTDKKWLEITNIDVETGAIVSVDFDYGVMGYMDLGNRNFSVLGFRAEFEADGATPDIQLRIRKIQDEGAGRFTIVTMEAIGFDATVGNGVIDDNKRTTTDDRSFTLGATLAADGQMVVLKTTDYKTFFTADENIIEGASKAEGIIVDYLGSPSGNINAIAHCTLTLFIEFD